MIHIFDYDIIKNNINTIIMINSIDIIYFNNS